MSLADQSLHFFPVSARVSVLRARGLRIKGKDGTNDAYATLQAGRETFRTSVAEKHTEPVWGGDDAAFIFTEQDGVPLQVRVLHRVPLGADKVLGLTVVNVHELRQDSTRENPQWFKLLNKTGKADKERGEVLLDIQFLKSSMSVSMIDLSDKSHSRLGKFKDKLRAKKKEGLSDSASAILPSVSQVLTDSEEELDRETEGESTKKKKNKLKSLFVPKSSMKRNSMSQSMSSLGTLPDKNSSISSSTSSGLNVESEGKKKKKFTFLTHKRNGSTDSKTSTHNNATLGSTNQNPPSPIDICINGSHVYREETQSEEVQELEEEEEERWRREEEERERLEEERKRKEKEEQRRKEEEEKERIRREREKEEHRRRIEEEEKERIRREREKEEHRRRIEEEEKESIRVEREKEEERRRMAEEKERIRMEREKEEERRRMEEREKERIRMEREKEEQRRTEEEEKERMRIEREKEEQKRRMEEEEKERIRMEREKEEQMRRMAEEKEQIRIEREKEEERRRMEEREKERIRMEREKEEQRRLEEEEKERMRIEREKEEQKRRMEEEEKERIRMEREKEEQRRRMEEEEKERKRMEKEEQQRKLEEGERMKREKEEQMRKLEEGGKRKEERVAEELRRKMEEGNDRKKAEEEEKMRIAEEGRMKEEKKRAERKRMMEEEEKQKEEKRIAMERRVADEKKAREEEERRIAEEKEKQHKEEERVREEKERKRAEMEMKRKEEEQERRNMEMEDKKKKEKQMREEQESLRKEETVFEESVISQSTDFPRSARISMKPSVSVSATVSQLTMTNTNPFLDDDLDASISENTSVEEATAKKGRAPLPLQLTGPDVCSRAVSKQHSNLKEVSKRPAPQPPGTLKMTREVTVKENADQAGLGQGAKKTPERHHESKVLSVTQDVTQVNTNPFTCDGPVAIKHNKTPAPKPRSGISVSEDMPRNGGKNLTESTAHLEEKASASNSKGNPPNWKLLKASNDITVEYVKSDLTDDLSRREHHLEDAVEPESAKPNSPCVSQDLRPEPLVSPTDGLPSMERSQKKSRAPLPPVKPKRTEDPSTPHQQPSLPKKTNLEQAQENHSNKKDQDNTSVSSIEIAAVSTPSSTVSSSVFMPLAEKSQVMKPCATESVETGSGSGSMTLPWAKMVPSDAGEVREQVAPTSVIRQHAVKPLSAAENRPETHESRVTDNIQPKTKAAEAVTKGPYSQLTQTELISLALRQQEQLSKRDARIQELEQYIDDLLVRVMDEKPSILMSLNTKNKSI